MIKADQTITISAPLEKIWDFLSDAPRVGRCMPGVESVEPEEENKYKVWVRIKIGPIKVHMGGVVIIENTIPMESMEVVADWIDKITNSKTHFAGRISVAESAGDGYQIHVTGAATVLGALSKYGQGIADKIAAQIARQFAENMQADLSTG